MHMHMYMHMYMLTIMPCTERESAAHTTGAVIYVCRMMES